MVLVGVKYITNDKYYSNVSAIPTAIFFFFGKHIKIALPIFWICDRRYKEMLVAENTNTEMKLLTQQQNTVMKNMIENRYQKAEERALEKTWESRQEHAKRKIRNSIVRHQLSHESRAGNISLPRHSPP